MGLEALSLVVFVVTVFGIFNALMVLAVAPEDLDDAGVRSQTRVLWVVCGLLGLPLPVLIFLFVFAVAVFDCQGAVDCPI